jgi:hypothetical protein
VSDYDYAMPFKRLKVGSGDQSLYVGTHHSLWSQ